MPASAAEWKDTLCLKKSDFYYDLPHELIAQHPAPPAGPLPADEPEPGDRRDRGITTSTTSKTSCAPGDLLVVNNSRVIPARIYGF